MQLKLCLKGTPWAIIPSIMLNGWKVSDEVIFARYYRTAAKHIQSNLFRPPYGRIKSAVKSKKAKSSFQICENYYVGCAEWRF